MDLKDLNNYKYSVLMPLWYKENEKYLELSLISIATQTAKPDEIVMVQDHEIPGSMHQLICRIASDYNVTFNIYQNFDLDNMGLSSILAFGVNKCRNELIARMDTDDISVPERCEKELKIFESQPDVCIVGGWVSEFSGSTNNVFNIRKAPESKKEIIKYSKLRCPFNHPSVMFRKDVILDAGNYDTSIRKAEDYDLWYRVLKMDYPVYNIQEPLLWFRAGDQKNKRRKDIAHYKARIDVKKKMLKDAYINYFEYLLIISIEALNHYLPSSISNFIKTKSNRKQW